MIQFKFSERGVSRMVTIGVTGVIVILLGGLVLFGGAKKTGEDAGSGGSAKPQSTALTTEEIKLLGRLLGPDASPVKTAPFPFNDIGPPTVGPFDDPGLQIQRVSGASFVFGPEDAAAAQRVTGIPFNEGIHSFFVIQNAAPPINAEIDFQAGFGFLPSGTPASTGDPMGEEPILRDPHSFAFFGFPDDGPGGWVEAPAFDVSDNFFVTPGGGAIFMEPDNPFVGAIIPQEFIGRPGDLGLFTVQMFGRMSLKDEFPSIDDPVAVNGGSFALNTIPVPLDEGIFADGFESGDTSVWSSSSGSGGNPPAISAEDLQELMDLFDDDPVFDEMTGGLVSKRFGILEPLPPARGTYFFDEFESFR